MQCFRSKNKNEFGECESLNVLSASWTKCTQHDLKYFLLQIQSWLVLKFNIQVFLSFILSFSLFLYVEILLFSFAFKNIFPSSQACYEGNYIFISLVDLKAVNKASKDSWRNWDAGCNCNFALQHTEVFLNVWRERKRKDSFASKKDWKRQRGWREKR